MPIRFRCAYCNQLMGIARRKAGTVVRCPTCAGQIIVPQNDDPGAVDPPPPSPAPPGAAPQPQPLFEGSDFDNVLQMNPPATSAAPPDVWGTHGEPRFDVERLDVGRGQAPPPPAPGPAAPGLHLTPARATALTIAIIVALVVSFGLGFLLGYLLRPREPASAGQVGKPDLRALAPRFANFG